MTEETAKDQLGRWLDRRPMSFVQIPDPHVQPHRRALPMNVEEIAETLQGAEGVVPDGFCHKLGLPIGATWKQAGLALQMRAGQREMFG